MSSPAPSAHLTPQAPISAAVKAWELYLNDQGRSLHTIKAFLSDLNILAQYLPPDRPIGALSTEDLNRYIVWLEKDRGIPCSPKTLARRITSLKSFFRWLHHYGVLPTDPAEKVVQRSATSPLPQVLTDEEVEVVLEAANRHRHAPKPDARPYTLLLLLLTTGIKKSECLGIHLNHIELDAPGGPLVFIRYASPSYRYKERKLRLSDEWVEAYREYLDQYRPSDQLFPWSPRRLEYLLEDIGRQAGLEKHLSFDICRWTCALRDYRSGMEWDRIRQKLGISKIQWREIGLKLRRLNAQYETDASYPPSGLGG